MHQIRFLPTQFFKISEGGKDPDPPAISMNFFTVFDPGYLSLFCVIYSKDFNSIPPHASDEGNQVISKSNVYHNYIYFVLIGNGYLPIVFPEFFQR